LVSGFFPFHLDFVRGTGLLVALAGALAAGPGLLRRNLASLRLALPVALIASTFAIVGAFMGLALPRNIVQIALGATIIFIAGLLATSKNVERPNVEKPDKLGQMLKMMGVYREESTGEDVEWKVHRTGFGLLSPEDRRGDEQVPPLYHGHLRSMGLFKPGLRDPTDGRAVHRRFDAGVLHRGEDSGCGQAQSHSLYRDRGIAVRRCQGLSEGVWNRLSFVKR
jgi:hypothetical protein